MRGIFLCRCFQNKKGFFLTIVILFQYCVERVNPQEAQVVGHIRKKDRSGSFFDQSRKRSDETLALRFSKVSFASDIVAAHGNLSREINLPLSISDYPLSEDLGNIFKLSSCPSVVLHNDPSLKLNIFHLILKIGGTPSHPENNQFWDEVREVIAVRNQRIQNPKNVGMLLPDAWSGFDYNDIATAVHDEYPGSHHANLIQSFLSGRYGEFKVDKRIIPQQSYSDFLRVNVMLADLNTWAIRIVGSYNFALKYFVGRARPEEVIWAIKTNKLRYKVPMDVRKEVKKLNLGKAEEFTAYMEGSPMHPSWPAMHAASSCSCFWLALVMELTKEQMCQAVLTDYAVSYGRTIAGVHYSDDNIDGMNLGQEILAQFLPSYLSELYGVNETIVQNKIQKLRFDWNNFDPQNPCPNL